ncbi:MAG: ATPase domain-containing protein [Candidatus Jordarchaeum sp.]|uniref:ATPase domain-containing protein n=1 Tax=Candidatus Jordarchaeum sp. TaxID=2823881 RepID=UPI00404B9BB7
MPKIGDIEDKGKKGLDIPHLPWLKKAIGSEFIKGGIYLLAGEPGIGKTTLSIQILGDISIQGAKVLYIPTEQSLSDVKRVVERIYSLTTKEIRASINENLYIDTIDNLSMLPWFLNHRILPAQSEYHGCEIIAVDSLQGGGLSTGVGEKYKRLLDFVDCAKGNGITCLFVNHVTKSGEIAGPKALEHTVDCIIYIRRALRLRPLFVPKNRFGPATLDPLVLIMDEHGLKESPHVTAEASTVLGYSGISGEFAEAQAFVTLPRYGSRPGLSAPFLPNKKIKQLLKVLGTLKDIDVVDLSYDISCYIPGRHVYTSDLDLPIIVALLSSYLHQRVDNKTLFVGEVDLTKQIRPPESTYLASLAEVLVKSHPRRIKCVYLSENVVDEFKKLLKKLKPEGEIVEVNGVKDLDSLIHDLWPFLTADAK